MNDKKRPPIDEILTNPVYCGIGPYPPIIDDDAFVKAAERYIKERGVNAYVKSLLANLRRAFPP